MEDLTRPVSRRLVFSHFVFGVILGILGSVVFFFGVEPTRRVFFLFDARISYPKSSDTVTTVVEVVVSAVFALVCLCVSELVLMSGAPGSKRIRLIQAGLNVVAAHGYEIFVHQISTVVAGKMRPDFIDRCQPAADDYVLGAIRPSTTPTTYALHISSCTGDEVLDGLKSFPSGHAASASLLTLFGILYFGWTYYVRRPLGEREWRETSWLGRLWCDLQIGLIGVAVVGLFLWIWLVGVSRYVDNKHAIEDVIAGWLLGAFLAVWAVAETFGIEHRLRSASGLYRGRADYREELASEFHLAPVDRSLKAARLTGAETSSSAIGGRLEQRLDMRAPPGGKGTPSGTV